MILTYTQHRVVSGKELGESHGNPQQNLEEPPQNAPETHKEQAEKGMKCLTTQLVRNSQRTNTGFHVFLTYFSKIPGGGGVVPEGGGARRVSVANREIFWGGAEFFFRGRNVHQVTILSTFELVEFFGDFPQIAWPDTSRGKLRRRASRRICLSDADPPKHHNSCCKCIIGQV